MITISDGRYLRTVWLEIDDHFWKKQFVFFKMRWSEIESDYTITLSVLIIV